MERARWDRLVWEEAGVSPPFVHLLLGTKWVHGQGNYTSSLGMCRGRDGVCERWARNRREKVDTVWGDWLPLRCLNLAESWRLWK